MRCQCLRGICELSRRRARNIATLLPRSPNMQLSRTVSAGRLADSSTLRTSVASIASAESKSEWSDWIVLIPWKGAGRRHSSRIIGPPLQTKHVSGSISRLG